MAADVDPTSLRHEELVTLVQQLRQQLAERDQEIERLRNQLAEGPVRSVTGERGHDPAAHAPEDPSPGSQEDLLTQLEKIYPAGR